MSCCAVFCKSRTTKGGVKDPELSFHTFPKCPEIRNQWIKAVRRENWEPTKFSRLCSRHFDKSSWVTGLTIKKLKTYAVPVIFEEYPSYYQLPVAKKRKLNKHNQQLTPSRPKTLEATYEEDLPTLSQRPINVLRLLERANTIAAKRFKIIKRLRESEKRLTKKVAKLENEINNLKNKKINESSDEETSDASTCMYT